MPSIADNLSNIRHRISEAARRSARPASAICLIAVSKTHSASAVSEAFAAGQRDFGENRVQEGLAKQAATPPGITWHLIGHLQSNKAKLVPDAFAFVHSVDSRKLAEALNRSAMAAGKTLRIYLQANLSGEATKSGVEANELEPLLADSLNFPGLKPVGLMTIPDPAFKEAKTRAIFAQMRSLLETLRTACGAGTEFCELSMGMSHDFEWAIEEGATCVRVGTAIFGERPQV